MVRLEASHLQKVYTTHSARADSHAGRVLFIKDGAMLRQPPRGSMTGEQMYQRISDTLIALATGGKCRICLSAHW